MKPEWWFREELEQPVHAYRALTAERVRETAALRDAGHVLESLVPFPELIRDVPRRLEHRRDHRVVEVGAATCSPRKPAMGDNVGVDKVPGADAVWGKAGGFRSVGACQLAKQMLRIRSRPRLCLHSLTVRRSRGWL